MGLSVPQLVAFPIWNKSQRWLGKSFDGGNHWDSPLTHMRDALLDLIHAVTHLHNERLHIVARWLYLCCGRILLIDLNVISNLTDFAYAGEQNILVGNQQIHILPRDRHAASKLWYLLGHAARCWWWHSLASLAGKATWDQRECVLLPANDLVYLAGQLTQVFGYLTLSLPDLTQFTLILRLVELFPLLVVFVLEKEIPTNEGRSLVNQCTISRDPIRRVSSAQSTVHMD